MVARDGRDGCSRGHDKAPGAQNIGGLFVAHRPWDHLFGAISKKRTINAGSVREPSIVKLLSSTQSVSLCWNDPEKSTC